MEYPCKKGELYIINHDVPHQFVADENSEFIIYNCVFRFGFFDYTLINSKIFYDVTYSFLLNTIGSSTAVKTPKVAVSDKDFKTVYALYEELLNEYTLKQEGYIDFLKADLIRLVVLILRAMKKEKNEDNNLGKNQLLQNAVEYIHSNFYKDITLEELSMQAFLSQSHFCRLFKKYSGTTVKEFTQRLRINEACRLLNSTDKKIADIAFEVGYSDLKHFNALFKKMVGSAPNEYRKSTTKGP